MKRISWLVILTIAVVAIAFAFALRNDAIETSTTVNDAAPGGRAIGTTTTAATPLSSTTTTSVPPTSTIPASVSATLAPGASACDPYQSTITRGAVASASLLETSGIAASRLADGVIWAHNDSGDQAVLYAIGPNGEDLGSTSLGQGLAFDWEDLAIGPGPEPDRPYIYVGDIGDNFGIRDGRITVYRVAEPDPYSLQETVPIERVFELEAPGGPHDFEALFLADGSIFVVTKDARSARVFRTVDLVADPSNHSLELVATLDLGAEVTGADVSWDGSTIAFRGYETVWLWHRDVGTSVADSLETLPCTAPSPIEVQGEAVAFLADGALVTVSEGQNPDIHLIPRVS